MKKGLVDPIDLWHHFDEVLFFLYFIDQNLFKMEQLGARILILLLLSLPLGLE